MQLHKHKMLTYFYQYLSLQKSLYYKRVPDELYLAKKYRKDTGKVLLIDEPVTYNEKLQWLKLHDRNPLYTQMVDKYKVREFVSQRIGDNYLIPLYGVWDTFEEIEFDALPSQFVLKATHDCGSIIICTNKEELNLKTARRKLKLALKHNYFYIGREWPYKNVRPRIIAEAYISDKSGNELNDFKFYCFNGQARFLVLVSDRQILGQEMKFDYFDMDFKQLPFRRGCPNSNKRHEKPKIFDEMVELAEQLSVGIPHVRVDLYNANGQIFFGEMTFYPAGGTTPFEPEYWDYKFGEYLDLNLAYDNLAIKK